MARVARLCWLTRHSPATMSDFGGFKRAATQHARLSCVTTWIDPKRDSQTLFDCYFRPCTILDTPLWMSHITFMASGEFTLKSDNNKTGFSLCSTTVSKVTVPWYKVCSDYHEVRDGACHPKLGELIICGYAACASAGQRLHILESLSVRVQLLSPVHCEQRSSQSHR